MMSTANFAATLKSLPLKHNFLIGVDSDGCVFDTMEIKQKECFCPQNIRFFGLQPISRFAREATEFVNLYSRNRGMNRYPAIMRVMELLSQRREVIELGFQVPRLARLAAWVKAETTLSKNNLRKVVTETDDPELRNVLNWSEAVDEAIELVVKSVPPFAFAREALEQAQRVADILVVSQTPLEALQREWREHDMEQYVCAIAGQEHGTKAEHLALASNGRHDPDHILMVGDAQGDLQAAKANQACFFPIIPGKEVLSWKRFADEGLQRFLSRKFKGKYQNDLIEEFNAALPEKPAW